MYILNICMSCWFMPQKVNLALPPPPTDSSEFLSLFDIHLYLEWSAHWIIICFYLNLFSFIMADCSILHMRRLTEPLWFFAVLPLLRPASLIWLGFYQTPEMRGAREGIKARQISYSQFRCTENPQSDF